jgi:signal transduction histidine kinase
MLDDHPDEPRRILLLDAIDEAALRGDALTTRMLAPGAEDVGERFDSAARLRRLTPLLNSIAGAGHVLSIEVAATPLLPGDGECFDNIALELVANACKAIDGSGRISVRLRARRGKVVLIVADTGRGMSPARRDALLSATPPDGAHGRGVQQVRRFARDMQGRLRIRSTPGRGTVVVLELPDPDHS